MIGRRLSFIVRVISSPPGSHNVGNTRKRLICSTRDSLALPSATPAAIRAITSGSAAKAAGEASERPCWAAYGPPESASKTISAALYDPPQITLGVYVEDVPGVQPAVGIDCLGGLRGLVTIALHHQRTTNQVLAVLGDLALQAGQQLADGAQARVARMPSAGRAPQLGHSPNLGDRDADPGEERQRLIRDRCRTRERPTELTEPESLPQLRQHQFIGLGPFGGQ